MSIDGIGYYDDYSEFSRGVGGSVSGEADVEGNSKISAVKHVQDVETLIYPAEILKN